MYSGMLLYLHHILSYFFILQSLIKHFKGLSKFCSSLQLFQEVFHLPHNLNSLQEKHTFYSAMTKIYLRLWP